MQPPGDPEGPAYAEFTIGYPEHVKLTVAAHTNGLRWLVERTAPDDDAAILSDILVPWEVWYKLRSNLFRQKPEK